MSAGPASQEGSSVRLRGWAHGLKRDVIALWIAARDRRTPMSARLLAAVVAGYALSPIDLIPDVIPVLGYLDDVILVPLGILLVLRLIPAPLMREYRGKAARLAARPVSRGGLIGVVVTWAALAGLGVWWLL